MRTAKKQNFIHIFIAVIAIIAFDAMATVVLFAYFSADMNINNDFGTPNELKVDVNVTSNASNGSFQFQVAGDTYSADIVLTNPNVTEGKPATGADANALQSSSKTLSYAFLFTGFLDKKFETLRDALILKLDGKVYGMLSSFYDKTTGEINFGQDFILAEGASRTHKLELELHIGAGRQFENIQTDIKIAVKARSFTDGNYLFVTTPYEFLQAIRQENHVGENNKTIYLVNDIDLKNYSSNMSAENLGASTVVPTATDVVIRNNLNIELNGKTLALNTGLIFQHSEGGKTCISSTAASGAITFRVPVLGFTFDARNSFLEFGNEVKTEETDATANSIALPNMTITSVSGDLLAAAVVGKIRDAIKNGVGAEPMDVLGNYIPYYTGNFITFTTQGELLDQTKFPKLQSRLKNLPTEIFEAIGVTVGGTYLSSETPRMTTVSVRLNSQEADLQLLLDGIISENCSYLSSARIDGVEDPGKVPSYEVSRNLYFPTEVRGYNALIEWIPSGAAYLSRSGKYLPAPLDQEIKLTAIISYQGLRYKREYKLNIKALPVNERLKEICLFNPIVFVAPGEQPLINVADYTKYLLSDATYTVQDADKDYFAIDTVKNMLVLTKAPPGDNLRTSITVNAKLNGEAAECLLDVAVKIDRSVSIIDEAHRFAQTFITTLGDNTFQNFVLPSKYYESVAMTYEIIPGEFVVNQNTYTNPPDAANYIALSGVVDANKNYTVQITPAKVPMENTVINIKAKYVYTNGATVETAYHVLTFTLSGIIHNNPQEVNDAALYIKLLNLVDVNHDYYITADEAGSTAIPSLNMSRAGLTDLKGIEYFKLNGTLDLSYNTIYDVSYLSELYDLKELNLSNNKISNIIYLADLKGLTSLKISNNLLSDISALKNLTGLKELYADGNQSLADIGCILNMQDLGYLTAYSTTVGGYIHNNLNAILTAYLQYQARWSTTPKYYITKVNELYTIPAANYDNYVKANEAINKIMPIYEFANVIWLFPNINGYAVTWTTSHAEIVSITGGNRAYILQPNSDVEVDLTATIQVAQGMTLTKKFRVLSRGANSKLLLYVGQTPEGQPLYKDARVAIPDESLRYLLFSTFDTNEDKTITKAEIDALVNTTLIYFDNKNIKSIEGLQYFTSLKKISLSNNLFTDLTPLLKLSDLTDILLENCEANLTALRDFPNTLSMLNVFGASGIDEQPTVQALVQVYNRLQKGGKIFKNDLVNEWKPYDDELKRALTNALGSISLEAGKKVDLTKTITWLLFGETEYSFTVNYTGNSNFYMSSFQVWVDFLNVPSEDTYSTLNAKITYKIPNADAGTAEAGLPLLVYLQANHELFVQTEEFEPDGVTPKVKLFTDVVKDAAARKQIINALGKTLNSAGNNLITRDMLKTITELTFHCDTEYGLQGVEIFSGLLLETITIIGGSDTVKHINSAGDAQTVKLLQPLNAISASLRKLTVERSFVDLTCLVNMSELITLQLLRCPRIILEANGINALDQGAENPVFPALTELLLYENTITNASPLAALKHVTKLHLFGNPCSFTISTNTAVAACFANLMSAHGDVIYDYKITGTNIQWLPSTITAIDAEFSETDPSGSGRLLTTEHFDVNYVATGYLYLPKEFMGSEIVWSTKYIETIVIGNLQGDGYVAEIKQQEAPAYVTLRGYLTTFKQPITYYFVVKGTSANVDAAYVDLNLFMENNRLIDPYFTYYCYDLLQKNTPNTTGVYTKENTNKITTFEFVNSNNTSTQKQYMIESIQGIQNFIAIKELWIRYCQISDLSPLVGMSTIQDIDLTSNSIETLWSGDVSVFAGMTGLSSLQLMRNRNIEDYSAICYSNKNKTEREGLKNLKVLHQEDFNNVAYGYELMIKNSGNFFETMQMWLDARKTVDTNFKDTEFGYNGTHKGATLVTDHNMLSAILGKAANGEANIADSYKLELENGVYVVKSLPVRISVGGVTYNVSYESVAFAPRLGSDQSKHWYTFDGINGKINISNVAEFRALGGNFPMRAYLSQNSFKVMKEIVIDTSVLNGEHTPYIEVTAEELAIYKTFYGLVENTDYIASGANFKVIAERLILDYSFARFIFSTFDISTRDYTISIAERANTSSVTVNAQNVRQLNGIELFSLVTTWNIMGNRIEAFPKLPQLPVTTNKPLTLNIQEEYLLDLSGITSIKERLASLSLVAFGTSINQKNAEYLKNLNLTSLTLKNVGINNYSFLLEQLTGTLSYLSVIAEARSANFAFYDNKNLLTQTLFQTSNKGNGLNILTKDGQGVVTMLIGGFDEKEHLVYPYLSKARAVEKGKTTALDTAFSAFNTQYGVIFSAVAGQNYTLSANGESITVPSNYAGESFEIIAQVTYGGKKTFKQQITCYFADAAGGGAATYIATEGTIMRRGSAINLAEVVPDIGLRYALLRLIDTDKDGFISEAELAALKSKNEIVIGSTEQSNIWMPSSPTIIPINSFEGIDILHGYVTNLALFGINTYDLSPLAGLERLEVLTIKTSYVSIDNWKFLTGLKSFKNLNFDWNTWGTGLEVLVDSNSLYTISKNNIVTPLPLANTLAYAQSVNNYNNYDGSYTSARSDQKLAALILDALDLKSLLKEGSHVYLKDQVAGIVNLPAKITYQNTDYLVKYIPLSSNINFNGAEMTVKNMKNYPLARYIVRMEMNGAVYERYIEFDIDKGTSAS